MPDTTAQASSSAGGELILRAIRYRHLIRLRYGGKDRIVEPHDYGIQNGVVRLLAYEVGGTSTGRLPNWRWFDINQMSDLQLLDEGFAGGRSVPSGKHHTWDQLFLRVAPAIERSGAG